jgi:hypothetical protein
MHIPPHRRRPVLQRAWRILRHLERFHFASFDLTTPEDGEEPIGIYTNPEDYWVTREVRVSSHAMYFDSYRGAERIAYADILRLGPASTPEPLKLRLADGRTVELPIMGTRDHCADALPMHRFLARLLSDLGRPEWPGSNEPISDLGTKMSEALDHFERTGMDLKISHYAAEKLWEWLLDLETRPRGEAERVIVQWVLSPHDGRRWVALMFVSRLDLRAALPNLAILTNYLEQLPGPDPKFEALKVRAVHAAISARAVPE